MTAATAPTAPSLARPTPTSAEHFGLTGPSDPPDPAFHAYRQDLADWTLTGQVIASHYAEPLDRVIAADTALYCGPSESAEAVIELRAGDAFAMLDNSLGWAWGYAGPEKRVGYVRSEAVEARS